MIFSFLLQVAGCMVIEPACHALRWSKLTCNLQLPP